MISGLHLRNHQRTRPVNLRRLRGVLETLWARAQWPAPVELGVHLVDRARITRLNETFVRHAGPTDVITFDYHEPPVDAPVRPTPLRGDVVVCVDEAVAQARRYRTCWQRELVRYIVHGLLHLAGYDDSATAARRRMRHAEKRLLCALTPRLIRGVGEPPRRRARVA